MESARQRKGADKGNRTTVSAHTIEGQSAPIPQKQRTSLEGSFRWVMHRAMRAINGNLVTVLRKYREEHGRKLFDQKTRHLMTRPLLILDSRLIASTAKAKQIGLAVGTAHLLHIMPEPMSQPVLICRCAILRIRAKAKMADGKMCRHHSRHDGSQDTVR